jgi:hypothetical protein
VAPATTLVKIKPCHETCLTRLGLEKEEEPLLLLLLLSMHTAAALLGLESHVVALSRFFEV